MILTDLTIRKLAPKSNRYEILDGNGLYLRIAPTGAKSWVFRYSFDGIARRYTIGQYPAVGLAEARQRHAQALVDVKNGTDPGAVALEAKSKRKAAAKFSDLLAEFWDIELGKAPSGPERYRLVQKDVLPLWRNRKVKDITRRDAVLLLDKVRERAPVGANRLQGVLGRMFYFAAERGIIEHSPLAGLRKTKEGHRARVLSDEEIKLLWAALDLENRAVDIYRVTKLALKMILLTGQRPGEVAGMAWDEIDTDAKLWRIPANRMKGGDPQAVPLCEMALDVIESAKQYGDEEATGAVFRSSYKPTDALTRPALTRAIGRHWSEMGIKEPFTPHDLRRTLRTRLAELGVNDMVAERVLGHRLQGMLAVYNQHAYLNEKRDALQRWERRLTEIVGDAAPENGRVIQLAGRKR